MVFLHFYFKLYRLSTDFYDLKNHARALNSKKAQIKNDQYIKRQREIEEHRDYNKRKVTIGHKDTKWQNKTNVTNLYIIHSPMSLA